MKLYLQGHDYRYSVEQLLLTLFPGQRPEYPAGAPEGESPALLLRLEQNGTALTARASLWWEGTRYTAARSTEADRLTGDPAGDDSVKKQLVRLAFYDAGIQALGTEPPWGSLSGVRPVKLPTRLMAAGGTPAEALDQLTGLYRVSPGRARLAVDCARAALAVRRELRPGELALYVGIPFCPSRCAYCSFISADVKGASALVTPYLDGLCREIEEAGRQLTARGLRVSAAYMGGGTPTTLTASQLDRLLTAMEVHLPLDRSREFTVEAGRPDTITGDKLAVLAGHGVDRISINPQTMDDRVLAAMGRAHTSAQIRDAMALARAQFGGLVNMDLIAGLPGDSPAGFRRSLDEVLSMAPANITVHTLALKKGARLMQERADLCPPQAVADMLAAGEDALRRAGYVPYYLYRQKYMSGSFENVGWCLPGTECVYNIIMMEELQSVLSLGAGGVTKLVDPAAGHIQRLTNPKYPKEYLENWDRIAADKAAAAAFQAERGL